MKQIKVAVKKRGEKGGDEPSESACELKSTLERLKKKGLKPHADESEADRTWCAGP